MRVFDASSGAAQRGGRHGRGAPVRTGALRRARRPRALRGVGRAAGVGRARRRPGLRSRSRRTVVAAPCGNGGYVRGSTRRRARLAPFRPRRGQAARRQRVHAAHHFGDVADVASSPPATAFFEHQVCMGAGKAGF